MVDRPLSQVLGEYPQLVGPKGDTGNQGLDGLTAYQVAVAAGFVGTQAAWLLSLKGAKGDKGDTGNTGAAGSDATVTSSTVQAALTADKPGAKAALTLVKGDVGLGNVDNTSDANKPVSTAQQTALDLKAPVTGPVFLGIPAAPTPALGTNTTQLATTAFVAAAIANLLNSAPGALDTLKELADAIGDDPNYAATITGLLAGKQALDSDLTAIAALTTQAFGRSLLTGADAAAVRNLIGTVIGTDVQAFDADLNAIAALTTTAYGRSLLTLADQAGLTAALANATSLLAGTMSAQDKTRLDAMATPYRTLLDSSGSHTAAKVAGTYGLGQGDPIAVSGTGILYPLNIIWLDPNDYPAVGSLTAKLRLLTSLFCNDVAPTGNFTFGLYPVTRPATSGGAGLAIYTLGTVVPSSTALYTTPAADSAGHVASADFAVPAAGFYCIGVVTTGTIAASAHVHLSAALQLHHA
jgi:hypothetical protein